MSTSVVNPSPFLRIGFALLPGRMKRMVFLTSLAAFVEDTKVPEAAFMRKLNTMLDLCTSTDNAMKFPIAISQVIWANQKVFEAEIKTLRTHLCTDIKAIDAANRIAKAVPNWLTGMNEHAVAKDLLTLFAGASSPFTLSKR